MTDFVSIMSKVDKVLHLYVEVRSIDDKGLLGDDTSNLRMLQCPDVLPHSHRGFVHPTTNHSPDFSPKILHRPRALSQSLPPSRCSSRHTVNFQLPNQDDARCPTPASHRDTLYGSVGQLSESRTPGMPLSDLGGPYSHYSDWGSHHNWGPEHSFPGVGRWSVPSSPASYRRLYDRHADDDNGTTSVVRYGYVEKASVNTGSQRSSLCQYDTDNPIPKDHIHLQKRNSDPGWHRDPDNRMFSNYRPVHKAQNTPTFYRRSTLEAVAKDATHRALREFGSPDLKRRYESYIQENSGPALTQHQQPQHSWSSSPSLNRKSPTLPSRSSQAEVTRAQGQTGDFAHTPQHFPSTGSSPSLSAHRFSPSLHQQCVESEQAKSYPQPHLPAGKPTDIQHAISISNIPANSYTKMCSNNGQNGNSNANNCKFSNSGNQRHCNFNAQNMASPENDHLSSCYKMEKGSNSVMGGSIFSKSDRVKMCTSPVPSMDPPVLCNSTTRAFCCENQPRHRWQNSPLYVQPHPQTEKTIHRSPQTMAGYRSPLSSPKSSSKSLSLPSSLNHTDLFHHPEIQSDHSVGFSNVLKSENTVNHHNPCTERRQHPHVSAISVINSPEVTRRITLDPHQTHHASVNRTARCEVYSREHSADKGQKCANPVYIERKKVAPVRNTPQTVCPIDESSSSSSESFKVLHADAPCRLGPTQTSSNTGSQVGWKCSSLVPCDQVPFPSWLALTASIRCMLSEHLKCYCVSVTVGSSPICALPPKSSQSLCECVKDKLPVVTK